MSDEAIEKCFEEEALFYEEEARAEFAKESGNGDCSKVNSILRRGMRIIRKAREEILYERGRSLELEATVTQQRLKAQRAEDFICMQCVECDYEIHNGLYTAVKRCCAWFPECGRFKSRNSWIPVEEGLPSFSPGRWRKVLVTLEDDAGKLLTTTAIYNEKHKEWYAFADKRYSNFKVLAWMIKPEAYEPPKDSKQEV